MPKRWLPHSHSCNLATLGKLCSWSLLHAFGNYCVMSYWSQGTFLTYLDTKKPSNQAILLCWLHEIVSEVMVYDPTTRLIFSILLPNFSNCQVMYTWWVSGLPHSFIHSLIHEPPLYTYFCGRLLKKWKACALATKAYSPHGQSMWEKEQSHLLWKQWWQWWVVAFFFHLNHLPYLALMGCDPSLGPRALPFPGEFFLANAGDIEVVLWGTWKKTRPQESFPSNSVHRLPPTQQSTPLLQSAKSAESIGNEKEFSLISQRNISLPNIIKQRHIQRPLGNMVLNFKNKFKSRPS